MLDPGRIQQVLINLLTNAIKFCKKKSLRKVTIGVGASKELHYAMASLPRFSLRVSLVKLRCGCDKGRSDGSKPRFPSTLSPLQSHRNPISSTFIVIPSSFSSSVHLHPCPHVPLVYHDRLPTSAYRNHETCLMGSPVTAHSPPSPGSSLDSTVPSSGLLLDLPMIVYL
jgi:hypothetical protein